MTSGITPATESVETSPSGTRKKLGFWLGIGLFVLLLVWPTPEGMRPEAKRMAATVLLMGCWWIGECLPLGVTALIPLVAYPLLRILPTARVAPNYANHYVFLLLGGFFIALAMQRWNLHTRIALWIIRLVGTSARRLVLGFMVATAFLSMWISNSATAMMMMPIGLGLIVKIQELRGGANDRTVINFGVCLMLGIAYAANIGGIGTLVGTFPNLVFAGMFSKHFPGGPEISFVGWLKIGLPLVILFVPLMWAYMVWVALPIRGQVVEDAEELLRREHERLGRMARGEAMVLGVFVTTAILWIFRSDIPLGGLTVPGWTNLLGLEATVNDATIAMAMGILCFVLPVSLREPTPLLSWEEARRVPWGILLLFGGGFAIAAGFEASSLTEWVGWQLRVLEGVPLPFIVVIIALMITFLTEVTSNTATTTMILPILAATAQVLRVNPMLLMLPATFSASCAFMVPIGTPPNAIVFSSGRVSMAQMGRTGLLLNLLGAAFITLYIFLWVAPVLGIDTAAPPAWMD